MTQTSDPEQKLAALCQSSLAAFRQGIPLDQDGQKALLLELISRSVTRQEQGYRQ